MPGLFSQKGELMKKVFVCAVIALAALWCGIGASAAESTAQFSATGPLKVATGEGFDVVISCITTDTPTAGVLFTLEIPENYVLQDVKPGEGIERSEFSYSSSGSELILMYLDDQGGEGGLQGGEELAVITLAAREADEGAPLVCMEVDASAVTVGGDVISQAGTLEVAKVSVEGSAVSLPEAPPSAMEEGEQKDDLLQGATGSSEVATVEEALKGETPVASSQQSEPNEEKAEIITDANGNRVQVITDGTSQEVNDITEQVLGGKPATAPQNAEEMKPQAKIPWGYVAVAGVVTACVGAGVLVGRKIGR